MVIAIIFALLGLFLIGYSIKYILFKKEIKISPTFIFTPSWILWYLMKLYRGGYEPIYTISGVSKLIVGVFIILGGIGFCLFAIFLASTKYY